MNDNGKLLLKAGILTDAHLRRDNPDNAHRAEAVFRLFSRNDVDLVINCGDTSDCYDLDRIRLFVRLFDDVFRGGKVPEKLWLAAGHDVIGAPDKVKAYSEVAELFDCGGLNPVKEFGACVFIGISQEQDWSILEENLRKYATDGTRKVFVITHEPPQWTVLQSSYPYYAELRTILNRYPQVISISGHIHTPVFLDRNIWQGDFTAVNAGSLYYWKDVPLGTASRKNDSCDAMIWEIYEKKIIVRRFDMLDGREIAPDDPWIIPQPFQKNNAPFRPEVRMETFPGPQFGSPNVKMEFDADPFVRAFIRFPRIKPFDSFHNLRIKLLEERDGITEEIAVFDHCSNYRMPANGEFSAEIPIGMLKGNCRYYMRLVPMNIYGRKGDALETDFMTPAGALHKLPFDGIAGIRKENGNVYPAADGRFETEHAMESVNILLPRELLRFRGRGLTAVFEIECEHSGTPAIMMACGMKPDYGRHYFPSGKVPRQRHSFSLDHLSGDEISIFVGEGSPGKYRIQKTEYYIIDLLK